MRDLIFILGCHSAKDDGGGTGVWSGLEKTTPAPCKGCLWVQVLRPQGKAIFTVPVSGDKGQLGAQKGTGGMS